MKLSRTHAQGFTLAELLVAVTLMAVVLAGLFALQDTLLRDQGKVLREISVRNSADITRRMLLRDIGEATVIQSPMANSFTDTFSRELVGWKNLDPFNMNCNCAGSCFPSDNCANSCTTASQMANWHSLVDMPKNSAGFPDPIGSSAGNNSRDLGDDVTWFRYCFTPDNRLMYYRGAMRNGAGVTCPITSSCELGCGGTAAPNCIVEEIVARPSSTGGGYAGENAFRRAAGRSDWIESFITISAQASIGGLIQGTTVQVVLSGQLPRGIR